MGSKIKKKENERQAEKSKSAGEALWEYLRQSVREALWNLMQEEVKELCGPAHERGREREHRRAGSERGVFYTEGGKQAIEREIFDWTSEGVSTRGCGRLSGRSMSASTASKMWVEGSLGKLEELRGRD